jgi:hypothetical protein
MCAKRVGHRIVQRVKTEKRKHFKALLLSSLVDIADSEILPLPGWEFPMRVDSVGIAPFLCGRS